MGKMTGLIFIIWSMVLVTCISGQYINQQRSYSYNDAAQNRFYNLFDRILSNPVQENTWSSTGPFGLGKLTFKYGYKINTSINTSIPNIQDSQDCRRDSDNLEAGEEWLYHKETRKCYLKSTPENGLIGPCTGKYMVYKEKSENSKEGVCTCHNSPGKRYKFEWEKNCYSLFDKGPCSESEIFVLNKSEVAICLPNPCPVNPSADSESLKFTFALKEGGECYDTFTMGFCPQGHHIESRFIEFHKKFGFECIPD